MPDQPISENAKINDADQDGWKQIKCPLVPRPSPPPVVGGNTYSDAYAAYLTFTGN